jgi:hypothetical protein
VGQHAPPGPAPACRKLATGACACRSGSALEARPSSVVAVATRNYYSITVRVGMVIMAVDKWQRYTVCNKRSGSSNLTPGSV